MPILSFNQLSAGMVFPPHLLHLDADLVARFAALMRGSATEESWHEPADAEVPTTLLCHYSHIRRTLPGEVPDGTVLLDSEFQFMAPVRMGAAICFVTRIDQLSSENGKLRVRLACDVSDVSLEVPRAVARLSSRLRWGG